MKIRASHILVDTKEQAENLLLDIENGVAFEDLAKQYSKCPSGRDGGDLRWFGKGMMVKPFEDAAFALKKGEISKPVETQFGWHLIKLTDVDNTLDAGSLDKGASVSGNLVGAAKTSAKKLQLQYKTSIWNDNTVKFKLK